MDRIGEKFKNRQAFVGFITGGDGGVEYSVKSAEALIQGGVDILEIGLPFSDPIADGPTIQKSSFRALQTGTTPETILEIAFRVRQKSDVPLILFSYYNPLLQAGEKYLKELKSVGFDGVLVVDLPPIQASDHLESYFQKIKKAELQSILLATPSTTKERLSLIHPISEGFLYYACQKGTTGARSQLPLDLSSRLTHIRSQSSLPVVVGFGISTQAQAKEILSLADGFVVGSLFVELMERRAHPNEIRECALRIDPREAR